ncbi:hypothetical protein FCM35_KLT06652 [Carex littledalei]|uniref:Uncharacterized protein n=1 Tax=Carex littledalei TaxID=544730 RepID=A0A833V800_9POAL|nr:hypothetical protein FCM35_KLT06652 [Carex littledalei]
MHKLSLWRTGTSLHRNYKNCAILVEFIALQFFELIFLQSDVCTSAHTKKRLCSTNSTTAPRISGSFNKLHTCCLTKVNVVANLFTSMDPYSFSPQSSFSLSKPY